MRRVLPLLLGALIAAFLLPTAVAAKPPAQTPVTVPISGTLQDGTGAVAGTFTIDRFANQGGDVVAVGTFAGTITDGAGNVTSGSQAVALPVTAQATCDILHLELGPLDLNLLGLMVHLDQVVLDISAQQGPGNLLGNLLCAVAGLLDPGPSPVNAIVALLNQILGILQGL
jgi:hypothetical protein